LEKRVIYCVGKLAEWVDLAKRLRDEQEWLPAVWVARDDVRTEVISEYPEALLLDIYDLNRGVFPQSTESKPRVSLDQIILDKLLPYEPVAMELMDRVDLGGSFSYQQRQRHFHRMISFWIGIFNEKNVGIGIFNSPPHSIAEYCAYAALRVLEREVRIFRYTGIDGIHVICDSVEDMPEYLRRDYLRILDGGEHVVSAPVANALQRISAAGSEYRPWYSNAAVEREARNALRLSLLKKAFEDGQLTPQALPYGRCRRSGPDAGRPLFEETDILPTIARRSRKPKHDEEQRQALKVPGAELENTRLTKWDMICYRDWAFVQKLVLKNEYEDIAVEPDLSRPFVYFAMHYQPERTTTPDGGRFSNQFLAISMISKALPEEWMLYVKEHPSQFSYFGYGEMSRWPGYYKDLNEIDNVRFVHQEVSSIDLMDRSRAVSTITGAAGWEALGRLKPVICFGSAWYQFCKGAFRVSSHAELASAFKRIAAGEVPTKDAVWAYASALEQVGQRVYTNASLSKAIEVDGNLADRLVELISRAEDRFSQGNPV
jgi:hypothetical protein